MGRPASTALHTVAGAFLWSWAVALLAASRAVAGPALSEGEGAAGTIVAPFAPALQVELDRAAGWLDNPAASSLNDTVDPSGDGAAALFDIGSAFGGIVNKAKEAMSKAKSVVGQEAHKVENATKDEAGRLEQSVGRVANEAKQKTIAAMHVHRNLMERPNDVEGHSKASNNMLLVALLAAVALAAFAGHVLECLAHRLCFKPSPASGNGGADGEVPLLDEHGSHGRPGAEHPRGWLVGVIVASYAMLIPAVSTTLFSFNVFLSLHVDFLGDIGYNLTRHAISESTLSCVRLLVKTGGYLGAFLVVLYAMILPALKVLLLVAGEVLRNSGDERRRRWSSACIGSVQVISKWATPDLFAYILMLFLLRHVGHPPLIQTAGILDEGFCCFSAFCLCSTFSTLAIHRPAVDARQGADERCSECGRASWPPVLSLAGGLLCWAVLALEAAFLALLLAGLLTPCMGLKLDSSMLLEPHGPVPRAFAGALESAVDVTGLAKLVQAQVSLWHCLEALWGYMADGEAASVLAFLMLAGFALLLTVADMILLAVAALSPGAQSRRAAMAASHVLKHISMLDVLCMGVVVVCLAGHAYRSQGFDLSLQLGLLPLIGAEAVHYVAFYLVSSFVADLDCAACREADPESAGIE